MANLGDMVVIEGQVVGIGRGGRILTIRTDDGTFDFRAENVAVVPSLEAEAGSPASDDEPEPAAPSDADPSEPDPTEPTDEGWTTEAEARALLDPPEIRAVRPKAANTRGRRGGAD